MLAANIDPEEATFALTAVSPCQENVSGLEDPIRGEHERVKPPKAKKRMDDAPVCGEFGVCSETGCDASVVRDRVIVPRPDEKPFTDKRTPVWICCENIFDAFAEIEDCVTQEDEESAGLPPSRSLWEFLFDPKNAPKMETVELPVLGKFDGLWDWPLGPEKESKQETDPPGACMVAARTMQFPAVAWPALRVLHFTLETENHCEQGVAVLAT